MMTIAGSNNRYLEYFLHVNNFRHADIRALCSLVNSLVNPFLFLQVFIIKYIDFSISNRKKYKRE